MFYWEAKKGEFPVDKWRFVKSDPHCSVVLLKTNVFLLIYCSLKQVSLPRVNYYYTCGVCL